MKYLFVIILGLSIGITAFANENVSRVQTPEVKACIATALLNRDSALSAARTNFNVATANALDVQKASLLAIPSTATRTESKSARQSARSVYNTSVRNARTVLRSARSSVFSGYKATVENCKNATPPTIPTNPTL